MEKTIAILIVVILLGTLILFVPTGQSQNIETPFGSWHVEVTGTTPDGNIIPFSVVNNVGGQILSWTANGQEISHINVKIYAQATGSGYDYCELDMGTYHVICKLGYIEKSISLPLKSTFEIPVNGDKVKIVDVNTDLSIFENEVYPGEAYRLYFLFEAASGSTEYITFRGRTSSGESGPWQEYSESFTIETDISLSYDNGGTPPPPPPPPEPDTYNLVVLTVPPSDFVQVSQFLQERYDNNYIFLQLPAGEHDIIVHWKAALGSPPVTKTRTIDLQWDRTILFNKYSTFSIVPIFSISIEKTSFERYEYNDNYLG